MRSQLLKTALLGTMLICAALVWADTPKEPAKQDTAVVTDTLLPERLIVTYFHGNARCVTCRKLEAYAKEAVDSNFAAALKDGSIEWRTVNFDEDDNHKLLKHYQLFGQALVLSYVKDNKELAFKNLDKIWDLVKDEPKYQEYVKLEVTTFLAGQKK